MNIGVLSVGALLLAAAAPAAPQEDTALVDQGRAAFRRVGCANCHMIRGVGTGLAPDLSHVGAKYTAAYLERWLRDPREIRPSGHMPALELSDEDVRALAAFLAAQPSAK
jgi:mono/diheme cytochrome c family protein